MLVPTINTQNKWLNPKLSSYNRRILLSFIRYFIAVPRIVLKDNRYSSTDKLVLGMINSLSNIKGYCYAKNSKLATELNVGTKTISNSLSKLKKNNIIIIEYLEYERRIYLNPEIVNQENAKVKEKDFQDTMEENFQYKRKEYKRKNNNMNTKIVAPIPIWMEHPELCKEDLATPEEQAEMAELLKEFKD